jgi:hypothetical protein
MVSVSTSSRQAVLARPRLQSQRGAAVFIVVMVLTLLTAVGIFAVRSASMADVAAGFDREGAQASLIAEYGVTASAAYLATGLASTIVTTMASSPPGYIPPFCESNGSASPTAPPPSPLPPQWPAPCFKIDDQAQLAPSFATASNGTLFAPANNPPSATYPNYPTSTSSLNVNEATDARFVVEMTGGIPTGLPPVGGAGPTYLVTLTSVAQVRPVAACAAGTTTPSAAQTAVRALVTAAAGVSSK